MKYYTIYFILLLLACSPDSETTFAEFMPVRQHGAVYSASEFMGDNLLKINEAGEIFGYINSGRRFFTPDHFRRVRYSEEWNQIQKIILDDGQHVIRYHEMEDEHEGILIEFSSDYGFTFTSCDSIFGNTDNFSIPFFLNPSLGWYSKMKYESYSTGYTLEVHRVQKGMDEVIAQIPVGRIEKCGHVAFLNEKQGWLSVEKKAYKGEVQIYRTTDGGYSWEGPFAFTEERDNGNTPYEAKRIRPLSSEKVIIQSGSWRDSHFYFSEDGGKSWQMKLVEPGGNLPSSYHVVDTVHIFALTSSANYPGRYQEEFTTTGDLFKSSDFGKTWQKVTEKNIYADYVFFLNSEVGLITTRGVVQETKDGGETWFVPVFPLAETE